MTGGARAEVAGLVVAVAEGRGVQAVVRAGRQSAAAVARVGANAAAAHVARAGVVVVALRGARAAGALARALCRAGAGRSRGARGEQDLVEDEAVLTHPNVHRVEAWRADDDRRDGAVERAAAPAERRAEAADAIGRSGASAVDAGVARVAVRVGTDAAEPHVVGARGDEVHLEAELGAARDVAGVDVRSVVGIRLCDLAT